MEVTEDTISKEKCMKLAKEIGCEIEETEYSLLVQKPDKDPVMRTFNKSWLALECYLESLKASATRDDGNGNLVAV